MSLLKNLLYIEDGLGRLIEQFKGKPDIEALLTGYLRQVQQIEDAAFQLLDERFIDDAIGEQLDGLGRIIGFARAGLTDDQYRLRLRVQILVNLSGGTVEDILEALVVLLPGVGFELVQSFPAFFGVTPDTSLSQEDGDTAGGVLLEMAPAGVGANFKYAGDVPAFRFGVAGAGFGVGKFGRVIGTNH